MTLFGLSGAQTQPVFDRNGMLHPDLTKASPRLTRRFFQYIADGGSYKGLHRR